MKSKTHNFMTSVSILLLVGLVALRQTSCRNYIDTRAPATPGEPDFKLQQMGDFLLQSPPGQINDVYNDLLALTEVDKSLFKKHNLMQNIPITLLPSNETVVLGEDVQFTQDPEDPDTDIVTWKGVQFKVDHIKLEGTTIEGSAGSPVASDATRELLEKAVAEYVESFYQTGLSSVHKISGGYAVYIVGNAYNPNNFWAGRWREVWHLKSGTLEGKLSAQVHYYEDGNVQLNGTQSFTSSDLPKETSPEFGASFIKAIQKADVAFQTVINNSFVDTGVNAFKNLRRALPITRSKIEWSSILSYKIGAELNNA